MVCSKKEVLIMTHFVKFHKLIGCEVPCLHNRTVQIINYGRTLHVNCKGKNRFHERTPTADSKLPASVAQNLYVMVAKPGDKEANQS